MRAGMEPEEDRHPGGAEAAAALLPAPAVEPPAVPRPRVALHWDMRLFTDFSPDHPVYCRQGAEGRVFAVRHRLDNERYAIKQVVLRQKNIPAVLSECRVLASLHHPSVVRYYNCWLGPHLTPLPPAEADRHEGGAELSGSESSVGAYAGEVITVNDPQRELSVPLCLNVQMEFCPLSLAERLAPGAAGGWPDFAARSAWAAQLCAALGEVHRRGMCHGDLKASNLLLDRRGALKVADFGMTQMPSYGTDPYSAPEQRESGVPSAAADMHAAGVVLVELLYRYRTRMERARHIAEVRAGGGAGQPALIARCLRADPAARPTADDALRYLDAGGSPLRLPPGSPPRGARWPAAGSGAAPAAGSAAT